MGKVAKLKKQSEVRSHPLASGLTLSRKLGKTKAAKLKQNKLRRLKSVTTAKSVVDQADLKSEYSVFLKNQNATEQANKGDKKVISFGNLAEGKVTGTRTTRKKDKQRLRHKLLLRKLEEAKAAKQKRKDNEVNVAPGALLSNLNSIGAALPNFSDNSYQKKSKGVASEKCKSTLKMRQRQRKFMNEVQMFKQIYKTREFQNDPLGAISQHLRNKLAEDGL